MPPVPHAKPENVLKRAQELIAVDQSAAALQILHEHITSKRSRNTPIASLEPVILLFIDLCVDLRKGKTAKDGLYQYKNIAQNTTVQTIEMVLRIFIEKSEAKVTEAQQRAEQINLEQVEDLEALETPESILMATVSGEQTKDRTDRKVVTPWLKFLWETYRTILDILRNNARLETMYQQTASQAFQFCLKYTRKTEFRRLCELLRNHLQNASKYSAQMHAINLNDPDTLQRHLDTRFQQLNAAAELELWQEAFRSVEDIHNLLTLSKRPAKPIMMANYYEKLTRIFRTSDNHLFHAASWNRYYNLLRSSAAAVQTGTVAKKEYPTTNEAEFSRVASYVILSALSIPVISTARSRGGLVDVEEANKRTKSSRLTNLLGLANLPTRSALLKDILAKGLLKRARPEIRELYSILEVDFHPLSICKKIAPILTQIGSDEDMKKYVPPLQQVILTRLFQQLSQVYDTLQLDFVYNLVSFPEPFEIGQNAIEKFVMNGCKKGELAIRINHATRALTFESDVFSSAKSLPIGATGAAERDAGVQRLQSTPQEIVRTQLSRLAKTLYLTCAYVDPSFIEIKNREKAEALARAETGAKKEHEETLARREAIKQHKEAAESALANREKESQRLHALREIEREQTAKRILEEDKKKREQERMERQLKEIQTAEFWKQVTTLGLTTEEFRGHVKSMGLELPEDVTTLDSSFIRKVKIAIMENEKKETTEKLRVTSKRIDHLERAYRKEELALLPQDYEAQRKRDLEAHNEKVEEFLREHKQKHEENVILKKRLSRLIPFYEGFRDDVRSRRHEEFEARRKKAEQQLQVEMDKRRKQVREAKERKRREEEEAERRRIEEEERLQREEEERLAKEAEEAEKKEQARLEQEQRRKEREEAAEKQRQREREAEERAEERRRQRKEDERVAHERPAPAPAPEPAKAESSFRATKVPVVSSGGGWRERLAAKKAAEAAAAESGEPEDANGESAAQKMLLANPVLLVKDKDKREKTPGLLLRNEQPRGDEAPTGPKAAMERGNTKLADHHVSLASPVKAARAASRSGSLASVARVAKAASDVKAKLEAMASIGHLHTGHAVAAIWEREAVAAATRDALEADEVNPVPEVGAARRVDEATAAVEPTSLLPFNTGGVNSPGAPPPVTEYASISLDTEMMDDDEIMAMGQTSGFGDSTLETALNPSDAAGEGSPEDLVPNKIHLRGLDSMSSTDVKLFIAAYFPTPEMDKLEWIDDTSLNIVWQDAETALAVLAALTTPINAGARPWELREAKTHDAYPLARLEVRLAFVTDRKEKGARERSRYYLFHPEEDRVEQQEKKRREQEKERRERRSDYRQRDYDYEERRYRSGSRGQDRDDHRSRSRYDDDEGSRRRGGGEPREQIELFPSGGAADRRSGRRSRSRSPVELFPERVKNTQVELFPESGGSKNDGTELFPEKAKNASVELFPGNRETTGRRRGGSQSDDTPRTLFSIDDPVEMPRRGQSPPRQRRREQHQQQQQQRPGNNTGAVELFPEKMDQKRSLADRIDRPRPGRGRSENMDMDMDTGGDSGTGMSIRGSAGGGLSIRGAAKGQAGHSNAGIELLPDKAANSLFNRISEPAAGRRGARRQKAEDMFG
ncbi:Eukaryotic translation initiation factor [Drechslerella dactyloides]|uniref:Eukaryotic translation initiation factor 3 subunit A n=1 Tax=Drechslerella dactyloides TaxID=74499 RepID=A0AAD6IYA7_DREDA|nr:Eukaryotic translation initiation factor [Drechslerella dactyloides]